MPFPKKMEPHNHRVVERAAIDLEEKAAIGLLRFDTHPRREDVVARGALQRAAKVLRRALETDDAAS